ncbi:MAG: hypothetical protein Tsb0013_24030 [Phycisphaerales bacterium]
MSTGANRYDLYESAVQSPEREARFLEALHGGEPTCLAEDFSGPASICRAWLAMGPRRTAIATDIDPEPLEHAVHRLVQHLGREGVDRLELCNANVLEAGGRPDIIAALNFGVCELHDRERLVTYFRHALFRLRAGGVHVVDLYGGENAYAPGVASCEIETPGGTLLYEWEQIDANPLTGRVLNAIHFTTPDGARMERAFAYDWRLWSVPEVRDAMREAGFASTEVHAAMGGAEDGDGAIIPSAVSTDHDDQPSRWPDDLEESYVCFVVGRV